MKYKAIFFDRDGTLTMNDSGWVKMRDDKLFEWSGQPFVFTQELFIKFLIIYGKADIHLFPIKMWNRSCSFLLSGIKPYLMS